MIRTNTTDIIKHMSKNELLISALYRIYADTFPERRDFWLSISNEEVEHSRWLEKLLLEVEQGAVLINEGRFRIEPIMSLSRYVQKHIDELHASYVSELHALVISADIESSLLESKFFEIFASDSMEMKNTFKKLQDSTLEHSARIKEMLEIIRENTHENTNIE